MRRSFDRIALWGALALLVGAVPAAASDWPQEGCDGGHSGYNRLDDRLTPRSVVDLELAWRQRVNPRGRHGYEQHAAVTVVRDGRAFASWLADGSGSRLTALKAADGTVLWHRRYRNAGALFVASTPDAVIANVDGDVVAFDARTGDPVWTLADARVTAATASGSTLFVTFPGRPDQVGAISGTDGSEIWRRDLRPRGEPLLTRGIVLVPARAEAGACLLGLDPADGETVWRRALRGRDDLQLATEGKAFVWTSIDDERVLVKAFDVSHGERSWTRSLPTPGGMIRTAGDGRVFVGSSRCVSVCEGDAFGNTRGVLLALDVSDGRTAWKLRGGVGTGEPLWWATAVTDGLVYVNQVRGFETPRVAALATADGRVRWSASFGRRAYAHVSAVADGRVYVGAASGYRAHPNVGGTVFVFALQ